MCCIECEQTEVCRNRSRLGIDLDSYMYFLDCEGSPFEKMRMGGCRSPGYEAVTPMETALTLSADRDTPLTPAHLFRAITWSLSPSLRCASAPVANPHAGLYLGAFWWSYWASLRPYARFARSLEAPSVTRLAHAPCKLLPRSRPD